MQRTLQPELLDSLPPDHPAALHNRRDLRLTNAIMGNHRWLERMLRRQLRAGERVLEIGAGAGELAQRLAHAGRPLAIDGLDLWPEPENWPTIGNAMAASGAAGGAPPIWHRADLRAFRGYGAYDAFVGNLIFHQFSDAELAALGEKLRARARLIIAVEPARRRVSQLLFRTIAPMLGANYVSLHDAQVSIAAGFRGGELARALGLDRLEWDIDCTVSLLGAYRLCAVRRAPPARSLARSTR
jgi:hypothetical protein